MESNADIEINIHQQIIISKLMDENNQLKIENNQLKIENNQLKEIKNKEEEKDSFKIDLQLLKQELHELILKNNKEERAKREEINNLQKSQIETLIKEIEELKNKLLLLTEVKKEKEDEGLISKGDTRNIWDAAIKGSLHAVKFYFRENPANIHKGNENNYNCTPLHYASSNGQFDIAKFLISKKVNIEAICSSFGSTPLMLASWRGHLSIMELLLESGAYVNAQDEDKWTSLHYAVDLGHLDPVNLLIKREADKTLRNEDNETPLDFAKRLNRKSIVEYLSSL